MAKHKEKLIIIDGNALIHRSFHALPPTLRTKSGVLVNAVYGFTSFLLKALNEFKPKYAILTLDRKAPTFRHEVFKEYKATRQKAPDELYEQIPLVKKVVQTFNIPIFELDGYEADDLIGTLCRLDRRENGLENIIITGDMDTLQLVDEKTKVYAMSRGLSDPVLYDRAAVVKRYGLEPEQIIDYKALRGDPSDNIPGVKGVGEKTAQNLLQIFKTLDGVYKAVKEESSDIKPRILNLLQEYKDDAYLSKQLATIDCQAPIKLSLQEAAFGGFSLDSIRKLFSELEFKSLLTRLKDLNGAIGEPTITDQTGTEKKKVSYKIIDSDTKLNDFLKKLRKRKDFTLSVSPDNNTDYDKLRGLSFSWESSQAYFLSGQPEYLKALKEILEDEKVKKNGHDLKAIWRRLYKKGIDMRGLCFDTMLADYLLHPGNRRHDLESLMFTELGIEKSNRSEGHEKPGENLSLLPADQKDTADDLNENTDLANRLIEPLKEGLKEQKMLKLFENIEMPLVRVLAKMEAKGIKLEAKILNSLSRKVIRQLNDLEKKIYGLAGSSFNINSPKQLQVVLFENLELDTSNIKKTKTGYSTADEQLEKLKEQHEIISLIQSYRELNKLKTTYLNALPDLIDPTDGRIHTHFNQTGAATGRLSSTDPNLQNIPTRTPEGREIRKAFTAETGYLLLSLDYSQIELRLAAVMSGDKKMIQAFKDGKDIHTATAAAINEVSLSEVSSNMRREAKAINFGILYGQGPHGLSQSAGIPYWRAQEFISKYMASYPGIKRMTKRFIDEARKNGYAETKFGRRRPLPDLNSPVATLRRGAERMAINTPIQGTAADVIKMAMIKINQLLEGKEKEINLLLQVHDELIFAVKKAKLETYLPKLKQAMQEAIELPLSLIVEASSGENWGKLK